MQIAELIVSDNVREVDDMKRDPFEEYLKESEPDKANKGYAWSTAIGLQAVDGLKTSEYLIDTAIQNIEGKITMREAQELINSYYEERPAHFSDEERTEEADKVSSRIAGLLSETAFSFSPNEYISIHRKLFMGIYSHAGKIRDYNITKKEWVLDGATVMYGSASELIATLEYDFSQEKAFSYKGFPWRRSFIILLFLFQDCGRSIFLKREIRELRQYFLSSICECLVLRQLMIFLRRMHGISEMRLFVPIIRICRKGSMRQQSIWKFF